MEENGGGPRGLWSIRRNLQGPSIAPRHLRCNGFYGFGPGPNLQNTSGFLVGSPVFGGGVALKASRKAIKLQPAPQRDIGPVLSDRKPTG